MLNHLLLCLCQAQQVHSLHPGWFQSQQACHNLEPLPWPGLKQPQSQGSAPPNYQGSNKWGWGCLLGLPGWRHRPHSGPAKPSMGESAVRHLTSICLPSQTCLPPTHQTSWKGLQMPHVQPGLRHCRGTTSGSAPPWSICSGVFPLAWWRSSVTCFFPFALLYTDISDCLLSSIPHPFIGPMYLYDSILQLQSHHTSSCLVRYLSGITIWSGLFSCTIYILEPLIWLLIVLGEIRSLST